MTKKINNPKISVITPTVRPQGLELVAEALKDQTFKDFEWVLSSPHEVWKDIPFPELGVPQTQLQDPPKPEGYYWSLNRAYNKLIRWSRGLLIVSVQDFTYFNPTTLEKFWWFFSNGYDRALISGVGHKYQDEDWQKIVWEDPRVREDQGTFYQCYWNDIEFNLCSIPKAAFYAVGGFDEELDRWAGMDHISVQERLHDLGGWDFYLNQDIKSFSLPHGRLDKWEDNLALDGPYEKRKRELKAEGKWPVLDFLTEE